MKTRNISFAAILLGVFGINAANAWTYNAGNTTLKLTGYGTTGMFQTDEDTIDFVGDWRVRAQVSHAVNKNHSFGLVYAIDAAAIDDDKYMREAFGYYQLRDYGRIEIGFTDSVARKLALGLPDVGGLRINDRPLFHSKITPNGAVISDTTLTTGRSALRVNLTSASNSGAQYGVSVAGLTDDYDFTIDAGLKIRRPSGKLKSAFSLGASFMDNPREFSTDVYAPAVTADWRAQLTAGMNIQYNSWIWGTTARVIYDENPAGPVSDGVAFGTGVSYDVLKYSVSLTYLLSDTGIWQSEIDNYVDNMIVGSFRYKYSEFVDGWISLGTSSKTPFISAGLRITF